MISFNREKGTARSLLLKFWHIFAFAVFLVLLLIAALLNLDAMNPDTIAYMRIAMYWSQGKLDLAINGYWGPLVSWLMVPFFLITADPIKAVRFVMIGGSVVYYVGAVYLLRMLGLSRWLVAAAVWPLIFFCIFWSVEATSPDLLMSGLILIGLGLAVEPFTLVRKARPLLVGFVYGFAYFAKAIALPITVLLAVLVPMLQNTVGLATGKNVLKQTLMTLVGIVIIAGPWIATISLHYGYPTFSTSGPINHAIVGPAGAQEYYQVPDAGRVSTLEDPTGRTYQYWSPLSSTENLLHQFKIIYWNVDRIFNYLKQFDWFGLSVGALFFLLSSALEYLQRIGMNAGG